MRKSRSFQPNLTYQWLELDHAKELQALSELLDQHPKIAELILQDLSGEALDQTGACGMTADQVFRALLLKQMESWSYSELHFHLTDSQTFRTFCRLSFAQKVPAKSTLAGNIKKIRFETLEAINQMIVLEAQQRGIERGSTVRVDCTVVETHIHPPMDSQQLWDCIRVLSRLLKRTRKLLPPGTFIVHSRKKRAKRRCREIATTRKKEVRRQAYRDLVKVAKEIQAKGHEALGRLEASTDSLTACSLMSQIQRFLGLTDRTLDQIRRRVFNGEAVPAGEKLVSVFEQHTDIIRKDHRDTYYGHKVCLTGGKSSMILDCQILDGNPADSTLAVPAMKRHQRTYGRAPRQAVFDGAFASGANLNEIKDLGVQDVVFSKGRYLKISDMAKSLWVYRKLRNFRAGIEGCISFLKRTFGLDRCTWRSHPSFKSYVWSSILACNFLLMARAVVSSA